MGDNPDGVNGYAGRQSRPGHPEARGDDAQTRNGAADPASYLAGYKTVFIALGVTDIDALKCCIKIIHLQT